MMKLGVLGATGSTGRLLVRDALAAGHDVVAYVRRPEALTPHRRLNIVSGSVEDVEAMSNAFAECDALISCLGAWPSLRSMFRGEDFQQRSLPAILQAVGRAALPHFVLMSSFGIGATAAQASFAARLLYRTPFAKPLFDDKEAAEKVLRDSRVPWTAVYPVILRNARPAASVAVKRLEDVGSVPGLPIISYAAVAKVLLELATNRAQVGRRLLITTPRGWTAKAVPAMESLTDYE